jgi:hypothetical protein
MPAVPSQPPSEASPLHPEGEEEREIPPILAPDVSDIDAVERHGYLFGYPIAHSLSPALHRIVYGGLNLKWAQFPLESLDMNLFLRLRTDPRFYGTIVLLCFQSMKRRNEVDPNRQQAPRSLCPIRSLY